MYTKLSKDIINRSSVEVDGAFIVDYMPFAPESYVKVYLMGLSLAYLGDETTNTIEEISKRLNLDVAVISEAFSYWSGMGIVNLLSTTPLSVEYLPVTKNSASLRKFSKSKYKEFNDQLHAMFPTRNILPAEYNEYYSIMEAMHIEPTAMLAIIAYSIRQKGADVTYPYILAVARNLAHQGCLTFERVNEQLSEFDNYDKDLLAVLRSLGSRRPPTIDDKRAFKKWTKEMGFPLETIVKVAKTVKKGGVERLNVLLTRYYENRLFSFEEIENFNRNRERLYELTKKINRIIGVYYEQLDFIIETYVTKWLNMGFDDDMLLTISEYCFKRNIRTLEGMNETVEKFYRQGILSQDSLQEFMSEATKSDEQIRKFLEEAGLSRPITTRDRDCYRTWTHVWKMDENLIMYAATLSRGNASPVPYINSILANWYSAGIKTVDEAKTYKRPAPAAATTGAHEVKKTYTGEQLNAMFDRLKYEDL